MGTDASHRGLRRWQPQDGESRPMMKPTGYRAYIFGAKASVEQRALINAADDDAAIEQFVQLAGKREAELWYGTRLVCVYRDQKSLSPASRDASKVR